MTFKAGDTVKLKSGGPLMTIKQENHGGEFQCQWFEKTKLEQASFSAESLEPAKKIVGSIAIV